MEQDQIQRYKKQLLIVKSELNEEERLGAQDAKPVELDQSRVGRLSRMDALQAQAMSVEIQQRRDLKLQRIASALQRIEDDDFGYCIDCGDELDHKRLEINPASLTCVLCAQKREK